MNLINTLTAAENQSLAFILADGSTINLNFVYKSAIERWSVNIAYKNFTANGIILSTHPNLLRVWRNVLPFGMAVVSTDRADPFKLDDFMSGRISVYILDSTSENVEVQDIEEAYF